MYLYVAPTGQIHNCKYSITVQYYTPGDTVRYYDLHTAALQFVFVINVINYTLQKWLPLVCLLLQSYKYSVIFRLIFILKLTFLPNIMSATD